MSEDYLDTKVEIQLVKKDVELLSKLYGKFDDTIDKMQSVANDISRIVYLQEQKFEQQEKVNREIELTLDQHRKEHNKDVVELHERITNTEKAILSEIQGLKEELAEKISDINKWRYMVIGGVALASFLFAKAIDIAKIFH